MFSDADKKLREARRSLDDYSEKQRREGNRKEDAKQQELQRNVVEAEKEASRLARFLR